MTLPLFFPRLVYKTKLLERSNPAPVNTYSVATLCAHAGVACAASGAWIERPVRLILAGASQPGWIYAEPGSGGAVEIGVPANQTTVKAQARWALGALAYVLFDGVARASIAKQPWAKIERPRGKQPASYRPKTNAERQLAFRRKRLVV